MKRLLMSLGAAAGLCLAAAPASGQGYFPHERHAQLFSSCEQCHAGAAQAGEALFPEASFCAGCHNGQVQPAVAWAGREPRVWPLRFSHTEHPALGCATCHNQPGAPTMQVRLARGETCLPCHGGGEAHLQGPDASCTQCHAYRPGAVRPVSHGPTWTELHGREASARTETCAACHVRQNCLDCHRPNPASYSGYHPPTFLAEHPVAAYARQTSCQDCHNTAQFCSACHQQAGLVAPQDRNLRPGYHDTQPGFIAGHGPAARQSLESCVSCHTERDCQGCHSALGPQRINPHGSGFDPEKLREKNSQMCTACHGAAIPTTP